MSLQLQDRNKVTRCTMHPASQPVHVIPQDAARVTVQVGY